MKHIPAILLTLGLVAWFQEIFTVEWSFAYCSDPQDGPASAVYGMPLPYIRWSGVSSLEYFWMPTVLVLNIGLLFAIAFPFISWAVGKIESSTSRAILGTAGAFVVVTFGLLILFLIQIGIYQVRVSNIASEGYQTYSEFRPVRIGFKKLRYDCTPSEFWFPNGWRPPPEH